MNMETAIIHREIKKKKRIPVRSKTVVLISENLVNKQML